MKKIIVLLFIFLATQMNAQTKYSYWSVGTNPLSIAEPTQLMGISAAYRFSPAFALWTEASSIFHDWYQLNGWENVHGYRFIFQPRFYTGHKKKIFFTPEFRLRQYSYNSSADFVNHAAADSIINGYPYKASQIVAGGACVLGGQTTLSKTNHLFIEFTAGIGLRGRYVNTKNIPAGYVYLVPVGGNAFSVNREVNNVLPYFPIGLRLTWHLGKFRPDD